MNAPPVKVPRTRRQPDIHHVLPSKEGGKDDVSWFSRQNTFEQAVIRRQVKFKREVLGISEDGRFSKQPNHLYPHILPEGMIRQAFYPGFADEISPQKRTATALRSLRRAKRRSRAHQSDPRLCYTPSAI